MRFSNKSTLFLCLILMMAAFVAVPVLAHQLPDAPASATDAEKAAVAAHNNDPHDPTEVTTAHSADHALVNSISLSSMYLTSTNTITATITLANGVAAIPNDPDTDDDPPVVATGNDNEARHGTLKDSGTLLVVDDIAFMFGTMGEDGEYMYGAVAGEVPRVLSIARTTPARSGDTGRGAIYTVVIAVPEAVETARDGMYQVSVDNSSTGDDVYQPDADSAKATFTMDTRIPTITDVAERAIGQTYANLQGEWSDPFEITFKLADPVVADPVVVDPVNPPLMASGLKLTTLMFDADVDNEVTFGSARFIGDGTYVVKVTPVTGTSPKSAATVKITVKVMDMAGNEGMSTDPTDPADPTTSVDPLEIKLAQRAATSTGPGPGDTGKPTVMITDAAGTDANVGKVIFTFKFSEALITTGENAFTVADLDVSNSPTLVAANLMTTDNITYTLTITPTNDKFPVKVSFKSTAKIADPSDNLMETGTNGLGATGTYTPPGVLGVEIDAPENLDLGVLTFTFTFAEAPSEKEGDAGQFTVSDIRVSNAEPLVAANLAQQLKSDDDDDDEVVYELDVTPTDATKPVTVQLKARSVSNGGPTEEDADKSLLIAGEISSTWTPPVVTPETPPDTIMIPANSYVVVVRDKDAASGIGGLAFRSDVTVREWPEMPDLERLFYTGNDGIILGGGGGGALILKESDTQSPDLVAGTVGISEIMWAIDANYLGNTNLNAYAGSQWIELHNLNTTSVNVMLSWKTGRAITSDGSIIGNLANPVLDVVTNFFHDRPGNSRWEVYGSNGASIEGIDFVSMARNGTFKLDRRTEDKADKPLNGRYTRTGGSEHSRDGRNKDHWAVSTAAYLSKRTVRADGNDVLYKYVGTPGRANTFSAESQQHIRATRRNVPASPVIINEVANRLNSSKSYEWIELRNVTDSEVNLRNYLISIVTSNSSDAVFYQFPANDNAKIAPQGVLLLVASDPKGNSNHPLAVGWNVDIIAEGDQVRGLAEIGIHATSKHGRYKVADPTAPNRPGMFGGDQTGLPDDGKFVLILRSPDNGEGHRSGQDGGKGVAETGKDDLNRVVDIAGWDEGLTKNSYPNAVSSTSLWPLHAMGGPFSHNKLDAGNSGLVHYRRHQSTPDGRAGVGGHENKNEAGRAAFARGVGYTGIGYRRQAADSGVHGGNPGYHDMTKNSAHANDGGPRVYISEIMLAQGIGRSSGLPQWIELYNASDYAVNLAGGDGVGWRLVIETPNDPIRTINFRNKGNVKTINPKQTVLIVSAAARSIGSDILSAGTVFPDTRVFNVYKELKSHFEMTNRTSAFVNPKAFNIRLYDGGKKVNNVVTYTMSDEIGNLDGNARTSDMNTWDYPKSIAEDGFRTSLVRVFDNGMARSALSIDESDVLPLGAKKMDATVNLKNHEIPAKYAWIRASQANFIGGRYIRHTWYGHERDYGTPANRLAQILPVRLSFFRPTLEDGKVVIRWTTESELDNAGFNILRSQDRNGEFTQVNDQLIQGKGTTAERSTYKWVDTSAKPGAVYYYQIEDVSFAGERNMLTTTKLKGLISAKNKLTTKWGELKEVQ